MLHEVESLRSRRDADVETVRERYARAIALAEEIDKNETADFDLAAMNLSVAYAKVADFETLNRQYARAFEGYSRSLAIAERVLRSPRTGEYTEATRKGFVARSLASLGWVTYELGKPAEAIELFNRSLALYAEVMASRRDEEDLASVAQTHFRMATLHQRDKAGRLAVEHFEKAASVRRELLSLEPMNQSYKLDLSRILESLGDAHFFLGQPDEAKKSYDESLALARDRAHPRICWPSIEPFPYAVQVGHGRPEAGQPIRVAEAVRRMPGDPRATLARRPRDLEAAIDWMLALARCGNTEVARIKAENLLKLVAAQGGGYPSAANYRLQSAFSLAIAADNLDRDHAVEVWPAERLAERKKLIDRSFEALDLAIASGFDDRYQLEIDPDIDALRGDPRFVAILEKLRTQSKAK